MILLLFSGELIPFDVDVIVKDFGHFEVPICFEYRSRSKTGPQILHYVKTLVSFFVFSYLVNIYLKNFKFLLY